MLEENRGDEDEPWERRPAGQRPWELRAERTSFEGGDRLDVDSQSDLIEAGDQLGRELEDLWDGLTADCRANIGYEGQ